MWRYMAGFWDKDDLLAFRVRCVVYELIEIFVPSGLNKLDFMIFIWGIYMALKSLRVEHVWVEILILKFYITAINEWME